ncbi:hypothetical protein [Pontibacter sp. G13]|uniref:hypothetical protein n=1 Tax=Pontibacter sp. G13 TaxID=3074898 RepID=UPI00288B803A|nr:hypothetical protein [Pontibacter sp. G13]WNJ17418.1 hypothetical protein RJD25_21430 [Pontibacter sp. G13]
MKSLLILPLLLSCLSAHAQTKIDFLLLAVGETANSKDLTRDEIAGQIMAYGDSILPILAARFADTTQVKTYSDCQGRRLTLGEIAMILADAIEPIPYAYLTGTQNCLLQFCADNPNLLEYYMNWRSSEDIQRFQCTYQAYLDSEVRKDFVLNVRIANTRHRWKVFEASEQLKALGVLHKIDSTAKGKKGKFSYSLHIKIQDEDRLDIDYDILHDR